MIKLENTEVMGWEHAIRGARNPMNSWSKMDSRVQNFSIPEQGEVYPDEFVIGPSDYDLMKRLRNAGTDHRKFMRMITVYVDITAPLYWWKEFDTYKIGTVANSCSTMHKIHAKEFTLEDFSHEHLIGSNDDNPSKDECLLIECSDSYYNQYLAASDILDTVIDGLNLYREKYLETKDKKYWWQMIQLLPSSYNQKRTVMLNYEVLANMHKSRKNHKLDEWRELCSWIETLPYHELITGEFEKCGKYYDVSEIDPYIYEPSGSNTSMVRLLKLKPEEDRGKGKGEPHDVFHFDACDECLGEVMDFILSKQAIKTMREEGTE